MFRRIMSGAAALLLVTVLGVNVTSSASAHTPSASATCSTLSVALTNYSSNDDNTVSVLIDGNVVVDAKAFGSSYTKDFAFDDQYVAHTWKVIVRTDADPYGSKGWSKNLTGTSTPCEAPDTSDKKIPFCHWAEGGHFNSIETSKAAFFEGHRNHEGDIYPAGEFTKGGKTYSWPAQGDQSLLQYPDCTRPVTYVVPNAPVVKDKCELENDHYGLPEGP